MKKEGGGESRRRVEGSSEGGRRGVETGGREYDNVTNRTGRGTCHETAGVTETLANTVAVTDRRGRFATWYSKRYCHLGRAQRTGQGAANRHSVGELRVANGRLRDVVTPNLSLAY